MSVIMSNIKHELTACGRGEYIATVKLNELTKNKEYKVVNLRWANSQYGKAVVATLDGAGQAFLPKRFARIFKEKTKKDFEEIVKGNLTLVSHGEQELAGFKTTIIEFK